MTPTIATTPPPTPMPIAILSDCESPWDVLTFSPPALLPLPHICVLSFPELF